MVIERDVALAAAEQGPVGAPTRPSIAVHVRDTTAGHVTSALVMVRDLSGGQPLTRNTDASGTAIFPGLRGGEYEVLVTKAGFQDGRSEVNLKGSLQLDVAITLEIAGFAESVTVVGETEVNAVNGRATLPDIQGTVLFAGKKTDVILLSQMDANVTVGNQRQVFAKIPGTQIWEHDSSGLQIGISTRGLDPNRSWETNQRMNGYDIMAEVFAYPDTYFTPPLDAVESIEMVRGASSLQFGAQFGGLVNYKIKQAPRSRRFTLSSTQTGGTYGFFSSHNQLGGTIGNVTYNGYYHHREGNGWRRGNNDFDNNSAFGQIEIAATDRLKIGFEVTGLRTLIHMGGGLTDAQFEADPRQSNFPGSYFAVRWLVPSVKLDYAINPDTSLSLTSAFIEGHRMVMWSAAQLTTPDGTFVPWNPTEPRALWNDRFHNSSTELRVVRQHNWLGARSALAAGVRYYHSNMSRQHGFGATGGEPNFDWYYPDAATLARVTFYGNLAGSPVNQIVRDLHNKTVNEAVFAENAFSFTNRLTVTPGFRFEHVDSTASGRPIVGAREQIRTLPMFGVGATFRATPATTIYGNITETYRPTLLNDNWQADSRVVVDPHLKDMTGYVSELGYRGTLGKWLSFDVGGFYIRYNDRLGKLTTQTSAGPTFLYTNVSNSRNIGFESYLETDLLALARRATGRSSLFVFSSVAPISARYMQGPVTGNRVEFASNFIGRWGGTLRRDSFSGTLQYSYTGGQFTDANNTLLLPDASQGYIPEQRVVDLTMNYGFQKNYVLTVGVNNLLNTKYFTRRASAYPGPGLIGADGRTANIGFTFKY